MTLPLEHPITPEWRRAVETRMAELDLSPYKLAKLVGTSQSAIAHILTRGKISALVPRIDAALAGAKPRPEPHPAPQVIAEVAALREAHDAISADIVRLEGARATIEERLAEAYEHRARLDVRIRELRGGSDA